MLPKSIVDFFYLIKPFVPRKVQLALRRKLVLANIKRCTDTWPINPLATKLPENWCGWPDGKKFAVAIMHDVDTKKGYDKCLELMKVDQERGFRSSFNFVPERSYSLSEELQRQLTENGFEIGVHDLKHDGRLFKSEKIFRARAEKINSYLERWKSVGFRPGAMHSNLDWIHLLDVEYDSSTFDTDPFEPKPDCRGTIFPFWVNKSENGHGYVELPYTLPQDFTLFILMQEKTIDIWKRKLDWIVRHGGMALITVHPDYINFDKRACLTEEYSVELYKNFLNYIRTQYEEQYWQALPKEIACFFKHEIVDKK